jgi:type 1 fimbrial protein
MYRNTYILASLLFCCVNFKALADENNAGVIHFTGEIIEPSCTISGDNGTDSTVKLGTYPTSRFAPGTGTESDLIPFSITLDNCPLQSDGLAAIQLTFNGSTTLTGSTSLLDVSKITTGGTTAATGIGIAISPVDDATQLLELNGSEGQVYIDLPTKSSDNIGADFVARYKSFTQTVTAGPADGDLTVNILYR